MHFYIVPTGQKNVELSIRKYVYLYITFVKIYTTNNDPRKYTYASNTCCDVSTVSYTNNNYVYEFSPKVVKDPCPVLAI